MRNERPAKIKEIAAALGFCEKTIRRYHAKGLLPTYQLGGPHSPIQMSRKTLNRLAKRHRDL